MELGRNEQQNPIHLSKYKSIKDRWYLLPSEAIRVYGECSKFL